MKRDFKKLLQKSNFILVLLAFSVYFLTRLMMINADLPEWGFANYTALDEQYYTLDAFDWAFGNNFPGRESSPMTFNVMQSFLTWISLLVFGNNYYGMRLPSLLSGFIVLLIVYQIIKDRFGSKSALVSLIVLISESTFLLANIVAEPTVFRMLALFLFIYYLIYLYKKNGSSFFAGILAAAFFLLVYPTNFFIVPAFLIWLFWEHSEISIKDLAVIFAKALLGITVAGILFVACFYFLTDGLERTKVVIGLFGPSIAKGAGLFGAISGFEAKGMEIFTAAYFENNFVFEITVILTVVLFISALPKISYSREDRTILIFFAVYLAQLLFLNDYPKRKLVFILPFLIYFCCFVYYAVKIDGVSRSQPFRQFCFTLVLLNIFVFSSVTVTKLLMNRKYDYANAMKSLSDLKGEKIVGGISYSFRLYNDTKPYLNWYRYSYTQKSLYENTIKEHTKNGLVKYSINYSDEKNKNQMSELGFIPERLVFKANDVPRYSDIYLYRYSGPKGQAN